MKDTIRLAKDVKDKITKILQENYYPPLNLMPEPEMINFLLRYAIFDIQNQNNKKPIKTEESSVQSMGPQLSLVDGLEFFISVAGV